MNKSHRILLISLLGVSLGGAIHAQDWPHWRGPFFNGSTDAKDLPIDFDREKRVAWSVELPGPGAGTPIIHEERLYLSSIDSSSETLLAMCFDRLTGDPLWQDEASSGYRPVGAKNDIQLHPRSNYASPSPVTDGQVVVFFYGSGDLVTYDPDGERLWARNLQADYGDFAFQWTFSTSPTIWEGKIFIQVLQRDTPVRGRGKDGAPSFLLALDADTGETLFQRDRASNARIESLESYATPIPFVGAEGRKELLVVGGDAITGHDPTTGDELWRWGTWNQRREPFWRLVPTPVVGEGLVLVCAPKRAPVYAIKLGGTNVLDASALAWKSEGRPNAVSSDVPTPAYQDGKFYVLSDVESALSCVDKEGKVLWTTRLSKDTLWRASPTVADGKVWCMNHGGEVVVVDQKDGKVLHNVRMGDEDDDQTRSSVVIAHGSVYIRTNAKIYCIRKEA